MSVSQDCRIDHSYDGEESMIILGRKLGIKKTEMKANFPEHREGGPYTALNYPGRQPWSHISVSNILHATV